MRLQAEICQINFIPIAHIDSDIPRVGVIYATPRIKFFPALTNTRANSEKSTMP